MPVFHRYIPHPPLSTFIEFFWLYEGERPAHRKERRLPDGAIELIFNLRDDKIRVYDRRDHDQYGTYSGSLISGPQSSYALLDTAILAGAMGVSFKAGGVLPFLPFPASELRDQVLALETIWGAQVTNVRGQLGEAATSAARFAILEQFLLGRMALTRTSHPAVAGAVNILNPAQDATRFPTIASVAAQIGLSQTRFVQVFREGAGMTPKLFARLRRFQRVLSLLDAGGFVTWADVVVVCGFFDQAHLIHEFQAFAGLSPSLYLARRRQHCNHVPLLA